MAHEHNVTAVSASGRQVRSLIIALVISCCLMLLELIIGLTTSSLALLSDAAHLLTDVIGTALAVAAVLFARRARLSSHHTFGTYRGEVLAALANAVLLFGVASYVVAAAVTRLAHPPQVPGIPVLLTAAVGLVGNLVSFGLLRGGAEQSLNIRGAYLEALSDLVGSLGVLLSGAITVLFGWRYADPLIGVIIGVFVLPRTWVLARRALCILFQHAPERLDVDTMSAELAQLPGVAEVHDLHAWTLTSGMEVVSAHVAVLPGVVTSGVLQEAQSLLARRYQIEHATLQVESCDSARRCEEMKW